MKNLFWPIIALLFIALAIWNFKTQTFNRDSIAEAIKVFKKEPVLFVPYSTYEAGEIPLHTEHEISLPICNTGFGTMIVRRVSTSCGCVGVSWPREEIPANSCDTITVKLSPIKAPKEFNQYVEVTTNDNEKPYRIYIRAYAIEKP